MTLEDRELSRVTDAMVVVELHGREWVVRSGTVLVSLRPRRLEAERAARWVGAHDGAAAALVHRGA